MIHPDDIPGSTKYPPNGLTIEHIYSRYNPLRRTPGFEGRNIICCSACNQARNKDEEKRLGKEYLKQRAKNEIHQI
jgi:hypothetical protein